MPTTYVVHDRRNETIVQRFEDKRSAENKLAEMLATEVGRVDPSRFEIERVLTGRSPRMRIRAKAAWILVSRHRDEYEAIRDELEREESAA